MLPYYSADNFKDYILHASYKTLCIWLGLIVVKHSLGLAPALLVQSYMHTSPAKGSILIHVYCLSMKRRQYCVQVNLDYTLLLLLVLFGPCLLTHH